MFSVMAKPMPTMAAYTMPSVGPSSSWRRQRSSQTRNRPLRVSSTMGAPTVADTYSPAEAPSAGWVMYSSPAVLISAANRAAMPAPHKNPNTRLIRGSGSSRSTNSTTAISSGPGASASGSATKNGAALCPDALASASSMANTTITQTAARMIPAMTPTRTRPGGRPSTTARGSKTGAGIPMAEPYSAGRGGIAPQTPDAGSARVAPWAPDFHGSQLRTIRPVGGQVESREIVRLAVPALGALVAEPLFQLADSAIVGHLGAAQLAGLGAAGAALSTLVNVCIFLAYGTTSAVARRMGAGDMRGAVRQGIDGMWVALLLGAAIAVVSVPLAGPIAGLFGASPAATGYAVIYLRISAAGVPAMLLVLAGTGILRGLQDTRVPLIVAAAGAVINVVLNYLLVFPAGLGIAGSATGTVITQVGMAVAYAVVAVRAARQHGAHLYPDWAGIRASAGASVALLVRTAALRVYLLIAVWIAARSGTAALAAHTVATNLWNTLALALDALAIAAQALGGHAF